MLQLDSSQACFGLTCLHCGQAVAGVARWLDTHWRAAKIICLDFWGNPAEDDWEAGQPAPAPPAGRAHVMRVTCNWPSNDDRMRAYLGKGLPLGLPGWVAGVMPLCQNLTTLQLSCIKVKELSAPPLLVHLILEESEFQPLLVASLRGLAMLETLHVSGHWRAVLKPLAWDIRACTRLRRVFMDYRLAPDVAQAGQELRLPPACTVALGFRQGEWYREWLVRFGWRLVDLRLDYVAVNEATARTSLVHAPQLSQLRHSTPFVGGGRGEQLCMARMLGSLPCGVESLHLHCHCLFSEQDVVVGPGYLRALRVENFHEKNRLFLVAAHHNPFSECKCSLTFALHADLERLCLAMVATRVGLRCLDAGAPAGLRGLHVRAQVVDMDAQLAAEVARRGHMMERCGLGEAWVATHVVCRHCGWWLLGRAQGMRRVIWAASESGPARAGLALSAWGLQPSGAWRMRRRCKTRMCPLRPL